jgi:hypothetical protein
MNRLKQSDLDLMLELETMSQVSGGVSPSDLLQNPATCQDVGAPSNELEVDA